jgi:DNA-binding response OmpR family regulator
MTAGTEKENVGPSNPLVALATFLQCSLTIAVKWERPVRVLLVEDEEKLARAIQRALGSRGYLADAVAELALAEEAIRGRDYDLILLDRGLPDGDGILLLRTVAQLRPRPSVIVFTALDGLCERVLGLDEGADDYIVKPFETDELFARIRAVLRRPPIASAPHINVDNVSFDPAKRQISVEARPLVLPRRELAIIETLIRSAGRVVLREALEEAVYGFDDEIESNTLDAQISRLRRRLGQSGAKITIHSVRGVGYLLQAS